MCKHYPAVSVIVPIYKVERYLQKCLDSIRRQTYTRLEIILVDDGSPDDCGTICDKNAKADSRIVVIHKKNEGLSSARNVGLDIAKGEYVSFIDADDTIHPRFIENLTGLCKLYSCDIAQCDYLTVTENSSQLPLNPLQSIKIYNHKQALYEQCCTDNAVKFTIACNKVYKKELFQDIRYPPGRIHEDEFTTYLLLWKAGKIAVTNQYMYYYLQHTSGIMGSQFSAKRLDGLAAFYGKLEFLKKNQLWEEYEGTLQTIIRLIKNSYSLLKEQGEAFADICDKLLIEQEAAEKMLDGLMPVKKQLLHEGIFSLKLRIVLYGAGHWGRNCYRWIEESGNGIVVGWIDNSWNTIKGIDYPVGPVDSVLDISFDYILIAIKNRLLQEEVFENLKCWGIPEKKIITGIAGKNQL